MISQKRTAYLKAMGIDVWVRRDLPVADVSQALTDNHTDEQVTQFESAQTQASTQVQTDPPATENVLAQGPDVSTLDWSELRQRVTSCTACELHQSRSRTVFGTGDQQADLMIIGEAPGVDEDRQGEPFVGKAGQLLNAMLHAIGLQREQVYIANILKCRPPNNRDPKPGETSQCSAYLMRQIALIRPKLILALGRIAAQHLLQTNSTLGRMRGKVHHLESGTTPVVVTYHPAYLLRSPAEKRKSWEDLLYAKKLMDADDG